MSTTGDINLNMGSFEMERMLRQNAHEKAFEIQVLAQRNFESMKNQMVFDGRKQIKADQDDKISKLNQDLNIQRSKKINEARLQKMKERNKCLGEIKADMQVRLKEERENNRERYLGTVKNLILQAMIKMLESKLLIMCREEDMSDIEGMTADLQSEFHEFMLEKTGRDEYECELEIISEKFLTDEQDQGCGGVVLYTVNNRIVCPNTLLNRLDLAFEEFLPQIRGLLFPSKK
mmetsp:Transcript_1882/g.2608  ORF Transcript_1882/g.2608 Transcript_1882/m.2608 type:complete len:233 (-) Transcript_1882:52-750(-)